MLRPRLERPWGGMMFRFAFAGLVLAPALASAQATQYRYDVHGQVVLTTRSTGVQAGYGYDAAANRTVLSAVTNQYPTYPDRLLSTQALTEGKRLLSPNGLYNLIQQDDGNLVVYGPGGARWSSNTHNALAARSTMQNDGNFVLYGPVGQVLWQSHTSGSPGAGLVLQDDGNLVIYSSGGAALWSIYTNP